MPNKYVVTKGSKGVVLSSTSPSVSERLREAGLLVALAVLFGIPYALTKVGLETIPPLTLVAARVSLAAILLWSVALALRRKVPAPAGFAGRTFVQGCLSCLVAYAFTAWGQQSVDSALAAVLTSTSPVFVCLVTFAWTRHEPITLRLVLGVVAGAFGVVLIVGPTAWHGGHSESAGQVAILLATVSIALGAIYGRHFTDVAPEVTAAAMLTWAALVLVPVCFLVESPLNVTPSAASTLALLANATFGTALAFVLYFRLIRTIGSMGVASVGYLKPAVGVFIGCSLLGEPLTWSLATGLVAIVAGVAAINRF